MNQDQAIHDLQVRAHDLAQQIGKQREVAGVQAAEAHIPKWQQKLLLWTKGKAAKFLGYTWQFTPLPLLEHDVYREHMALFKHGKKLCQYEVRVWDKSAKEKAERMT